METILHDFNQNVTTLVTEFLEKSIEIGGLSNFTDNLLDRLMEAGYNITKFALEFAEEKIFELAERRKLFKSLEKDERKIVTKFGEISFKRRYYLDVEKNERVYLLDEYFKLAPNERLLENVEVSLIEEAIESSYEKAGESAAYKTKISKQTVMNKLSELNITVDTERTNKAKKVVDYIYCIADEDHVHLQKGGIEEPRLVIVYDSILSNGKRVELCNKKHFGGVYRGEIDALWEEVLTYLNDSYDLNKVKKIYILGDGANWIKTGLEWIPNSVNVLDRYHLSKAINGIVGNETKETKKEKQLYKRRIYKSLGELNFEETQDIVYEILAEEMEESTRNRKLKLLNYILNNRESIANLYIHSENLHGCSAEGHVSHLYSARLSSRPLGWKSITVNNISKLRLLKADKVEIKQIVQNKRKVIEFPKIEKITRQANKKIGESLHFKTAELPIMQFGTKSQRNLFKGIIACRKII